MDIDTLPSPRYGHNTWEGKRVICDWKLDDIHLRLHEVEMLGHPLLCVSVSSASGLGNPMFIWLNNDVEEIRLAANQRAANLMQIIRHHNPEIEKELDKHPAVAKRELEASAGAEVAATKRRSSRL